MSTVYPELEYVDVFDRSDELRLKLASDFSDSNFLICGRFEGCCGGLAGDGV